ncbi:MAG: hypothetical protein ABI837_09630 [Acidobacteriota bacterium]
MILRSLLFALSFVPAILAADSSIVGTWELVAATPVDGAEVDPHGFMNHKTRYTEDGRIYMIPADQRLDESAFARYTFDGKTRTIVLPEREPVKNLVAVRGAAMTLTFDSGRKLTYRRMKGERPWDRILEPRSLEVLKTSGALPIVRPVYDSRDYSHLPFAQRIGGVWEIVSYADVKYQVPPHGLPNDKYVITGSRISMVPPDQTKVHGDSQATYRIGVKGRLVVDGETWTVSFDRWQRMVIRRDQDEITLRLVQKATAPIPRLPVTVALLPEE